MDSSYSEDGAGDGNRTRVPSLEGWCPDRCATPALDAGAGIEPATPSL